MAALGKGVVAFTSMGLVSGFWVLLAAPPREKIDRGRYLVEQASMCIDCHTPATAKGEPDRTKWMGGADLPFKPTIPMPAWADFAPALAGLQGYSDAEIIRALQTSIGPKGNPLRPPMPRYRLSRDDAEAVVAYLRSLTPFTAAPARR